MAYTTLNTTTGFSLKGLISNIKTGYIRWIEQIEAQRVEPYRRRIAALHALSDEDLAIQGIRREEIEIRVLGSLYYC